jgi:L-2-hydroxycarboxylate dehydrogenase (NAD+)
MVAGPLPDQFEGDVYMSETKKTIAHGQLLSFTKTLFATAGMSEQDAATCGEFMVQTNLWGIDSHGVLRAPIYIKRLLSGAMNKSADIKSIKDAGALEVLDGDDGCGYVVGRAAMERAIEKAEKFSLAAVGAIRSNHFGAAALYTRMAAERGMIGISMTNVVPNMVVPGGSKPIVGNNPLAISVPTFGEFPFTLDISMSAVAGGKLLLASKKGEKIPFDWATDKDGRPTDDPDKGFAGFLLPLAGHKGYGLALAIDLLSGLMTGGSFLHDLRGLYKHSDEPSRSGHLFMVINPLVFMDKSEFTEKMADFQRQIKESPMWNESAEMLLPGEIEYRVDKQRRRDGIVLPPDLLVELNSLAAELGMKERL